MDRVDFAVLWLLLPPERRRQTYALAETMVLEEAHEEESGARRLEWLERIERAKQEREQ
jgi:hypothetical protein